MVRFNRDAIICWRWHDDLSIFVGEKDLFSCPKKRDVVSAVFMCCLEFRRTHPCVL